MMSLMVDMRKGVCPLCGHNEIIRAAADTLDQFAIRRPLSVAYEMGWTEARSVGRLSYCICRSCGFTQLFTLEPEKVPIGERYGTSLVKGGEQSGPYR